ncbi:MAG: DUF2461 domain-containing protein [Flavobacteriaceae bacterium]|nr:DUF2461 domain-containing protein [Flavobacteriaceae bacterium]MCI5087585.1 DUF2461 domain-containing protein [Flavobacteriaceae bacterium]CAI8199104.1 MAG: Uncharacterised protein [SAR116 cluster bacterium]
MSRITKEIFDFLKDLSQNNNREWFETHKAIFKEHQLATKKVFESVKEGIQIYDDIEKMKMFRIYRDVRFSKDKTPYKDFFSASMSRSGAALRGSYYMHLKPGDAFLAVGFWDPNKEDLLRIRKEIEIDASDFYEFLKAPEFRADWGDFSGETLKTAPKGFDKNHPDIALLRRKNYVFVKPLTDAQLLHEDFVKQTVSSFHSARPFLNLMSDILTTDLNGSSIL